MVTGGLTPEDVADPEREIAFPESVVSLFAGELGQPHGGFPRALQEKILKDREPITVRPGSVLPDADLDAGREEAEKGAQRPISDAEFASWLMYPQVFTEYATARRQYSDVSVLPTPVYFYGMEPDEEIAVDIERGRTLFIRYVARSETD
ncbi:MAG: pyruvate carboxylase, partial [Nitrospinae bacterium]|nr:pyruvate carboxylase [Nitrospinota bacterium]